ncbi:MAG: nuclear transport factor 2 family protein [Anaerolineales bacterium]|jgi:hypothetical protein|nr:nuclear transport factor 2 family protein [Anaerolineales bacterium]
MRLRLFPKIIIVSVLALLLPGACTRESGGASAAIESYLQALVAKDANQLVAASCAAWEASARQELRTFDAVDVSLKELSCQSAEQNGDTARVSCSGQITANYGNEVLEINLADRSYTAVNEAGEWRMCGYQ